MAGMITMIIMMLTNSNTDFNKGTKSNTNSNQKNNNISIRPNIIIQTKKTNNKINYGDLTNVVYINTNSRIDKGCRYVSVKRGSIDYGEKIYVCDS